jgi:VWFA-related protein
MKSTGLVLLLILTAAAAPSSSSQTRPRRAEPKTSVTPTAANEPAPASGTPEVGEDDVVRIETNLVTVPVSVMDRDGRYVTDLRKEDFRVYENGVEQQVAYFATVDRPFTVVLTLDTSASTWSKLSQIKEAALAFVEQLRPDDTVMVTSFARGFTVKCRPTTDREQVREAIRGTGKGLSTHLYDAMERLMRKELAGIGGRKAVVLFTDGVDATSNDATYESTVALAEELDAIIYPIRYDTYDPSADRGGSQAPAPQRTRSRLPSILRRIPLPLPTVSVGGGGGSNGSSRADYERGERYLQDLAELTGGRVYEADRDLSRLREAFTHIAEELRRQYSIGYYRNRQAREGERLQIKVRVNRTEVAVRARGGYVYKGAKTAEPSTVKDKERAPAPPVLQKKPFDGRL